MKFEIIIHRKYQIQTEVQKVVLVLSLKYSMSMYIVVSEYRSKSKQTIITMQVNLDEDLPDFWQKLLVVAASDRRRRRIYRKIHTYVQCFSFKHHFQTTSLMFKSSLLPYLLQVQV